MLLETESGVLVDIETSVNIRYGYDIRGEVVGEDGTAELGDASPTSCAVTAVSPAACPLIGGSGSCAPTTSSSRSGSTRCRRPGATGPSSWDGYAAAVVSDARVEALRQRRTVRACSCSAKPDLYAKEQ